MTTARLSRRHVLVRNKGTTFLVALALVLTAVLIWDRGNVSTNEAGQRDVNLVEAWRPDDVSRIELSMGGRDVSIVHERNTDGQLTWVLMEGDRRLDGDEQELTDFVSNLELGMFVRELDEVDRDALGLTAPRTTITIRMGKLQYVMRVGGDAPTPKGAAYLEVEGGSRGRVIYVISESTKNELLIDVQSLLARRLAMLFSPSVNKYSFTTPAGKLVLERGGWGGSTAGAFMLVAKGIDRVRANRSKVDQLFLAVSDIEVETFVEGKVEPESPLTIELEPSDADTPPVRLVLGGAPKGVCDDGYALAVREKPDGVAGCVDEAVVERLKVTPAQLRDRHVVGTAAGDIIELKMSDGTDTVDVARKAEGWHMRKPTEGEAASEPMERLLKRMIAAKGTLVASPDLEGLGLVKPRATVRFIGLPERVGSEAGKEREEVITVGAVVDGSVHVKRKDDGAVIALDVDTGNVFLPRPTLLRTTRIFDEQRKYVRGLVSNCGGRRQELARDLSTAWEFVEPKDAEVGADGALATDVIDAMRTLQAVRWVAEKPAERHGLDNPWCTLTIKIEEPDEADASGDTKIKRELTVHLGAQAQGGFFAKTGDSDAVFVAPRSLRNAADQWFLSRPALLPPVSKANKITLRGQGDRTLEMVKRGEVWKVTGGADSLGIAVATALEELGPEVAIARGPAKAEHGFDAPVMEIELTQPGQKEPLTISIGKAATWRNALVYHVRRSDIGVTYLVARQRVQPIVDAL